MRSVRHPSRRFLRRRGKILILAGLLMPVLVGGVALSVDTGVIATADAQLKTATDAAALAGARELISEARFKGTTDMATEITNAQTRAVGRGLTNAVLGIAPTIRPQDASIGYHELNKPGASFFRTDVAHNLYNSVQVKGSRVAVPSYFSRIFGRKSTSLSATSTATIENFPVTSFRSDLGINTGILPIALDKPTYDAMIAGTTTDQFSFFPSLYNPPIDNGVRVGPDGFKESKLYPVKDGTPGNWGTINVAVSNNSTPDISRQIRNGITPDEIHNRVFQQPELAGAVRHLDQPAHALPHVHRQHGHQRGDQGRPDQHHRQTRLFTDLRQIGLFRQQCHVPGDRLRRSADRQRGFRREPQIRDRSAVEGRGPNRRPRYDADHPVDRRGNHPPAPLAIDRRRTRSSS